jgi:hypothetical protein
MTLTSLCAELTVTKHAVSKERHSVPKTDLALRCMNRP